jgi:TRAP-type C4-dicarboxylate transport system permease small subunit
MFTQMLVRCLGRARLRPTAVVLVTTVACFAVIATLSTNSRLAKSAVLSVQSLPAIDTQQSSAPAVAVDADGDGVPDGVPTGAWTTLLMVPAGFGLLVMALLPHLASRAVRPVPQPPRRPAFGSLLA